MFKSDQKKILLLGGSYAQIPAIKAAKERGLYTILCDYLSNNPGKECADEYINASTTDIERILEIARDCSVNYVWAYASDPAASTAAFVSEKLGLPGNSYESVRTLSEKHLFRQLLITNDLNSPQVLSLTKEELSAVKQLNIKYPLIVKPVDSSGSKGVRLIYSFSEFGRAAEHAFSFSRSNRIIVEEFINSEKGDIHGDGFVVNGELVFSYLGDHIYGSLANTFNPTGTTWPSTLSKEILDEIESQIQKIISASGFVNGAINIEARITDKDKIYIMELGPRSGGHFVPQVIKYATGFDMIDAGLKVATGEIINNYKKRNEFAAYYAIHSDCGGMLKKLSIDRKISSYIKVHHQYVKIGDEAKSFNGANAAIGILLMVFPTKEEMENIMCSIEQYVEIEVE